MKKKILAFLLTGAMFLGAVPAQVYASAPQESVGIENTEDDQEDFNDQTEDIEEEKTDEEAEQTEETTELEQEQTETTDEALADKEEGQTSQDETECKDSEQIELPNIEQDAKGRESISSTDQEIEAAKQSAEEQAAPVADKEESLNWTPPTGGLQLREVEVADEIWQATVPVDDSDFAGIDGLSSPVKGSQNYENNWDVYSSNYLYNRLDAKKRKFWDRLNKVCNAYLTQNLNAMNVGDGYAIAANQINYDNLGLSDVEAGDVFVMFAYSNPQYYFLESGIVPQNPNGNWLLFFYDKFQYGSVRKSETARVKAKIDAMKAKIQKGSNDVEKARIAHDLIVENIKYDPGFSYNPIQPVSTFHQGIYSVLFEDYTVCAGYTKTFALLMNSMGIDTIGITSDVHAWNVICLNDSWYNVDLTWNDLDGKYGYQKQYTYFGVSESRLRGELEQSDGHKKESFYKGLTPKCSKDFGSTLERVGKVYTPSQTTQTPTISQKKTSTGMAVTLKTNTSGADIYYTLDGKEPSSSFTRSYHYTGPFKLTKKVTLKVRAVSDGKWDSKVSSASVKGKMYTVKFNTAGGSKISSKQVWPGEAVSKPAKNPTRKGYLFAGWYKGKGGKTKWIFNNKITKNTTIYAKWIKVKVAKPSISKIKNLSGKKMSVSIKKLKDVKGYQIRYSTNSKMKSAKKAQAKTPKVTASRLQKGKKYYVQVRAYKFDSAKNRVYGNWSKTKSITIKK